MDRTQKHGTEAGHIYTTKGEVIEAYQKGMTQRQGTKTGRMVQKQDTVCRTRVQDTKAGY